MAIPQEIAHLIALAKEQETAETILDDLRTRKAAIQAELVELNAKITAQVASVQTARTALKAAAAAL